MVDYVNTIQAHKMLLSVLDEHGLHDVTGKLNPRLTRVFGRYKWGLQGKSVELSSQLVQLNDETIVRTVILHEVAHALTEGHGHDRVWQRKCIEIGGDGKRCYDSSTTNTIQRSRVTKLYTLVCQSCGYEGGRYRRRMNGYRHKRCGGNLDCVQLI